MKGIVKEKTEGPKEWRNRRREEGKWMIDDGKVEDEHG